MQGQQPPDTVETDTTGTHGHTADGPSVIDVIAQAIGYRPSVDGLLGSGLSRLLAYQQATEIARALGLPGRLNASVVRDWGSGAVIHLGPKTLARAVAGGVS